jgi:hypothetical protein
MYLKTRYLDDGKCSKQQCLFQCLCFLSCSVGSKNHKKVTHLRHDLHLAAKRNSSLLRPLTFYLKSFLQKITLKGKQCPFDVSSPKLVYAALIMDAVSTSEMSVSFYETTRRNIPEVLSSSHTKPYCYSRFVWLNTINEACEIANDAFGKQCGIFLNYRTDNKYDWVCRLL